MKNLYRQSVKQKYSTLYHRVSKAIQTGKFSTYTAAKKQSFYKRLKRYERRLKHWGIAVISTTTLFLSPIIATGQTFTAQTGTNNPFDGVDVGIESKPTFSDIDNDGDFDAFIGEGYGNIRYYQNTGTISAPIFTVQTGTNNPFDGVVVGVYAAPTLIDIDNDGDFDAFIGERYGTIMYYKNTSPVLPVEMIAFTAQVQDNQTTLLQWQTASEENNQGFEVQRSADGKNWEAIHFVAGNGTTLETQNYTFTDDDPLAGVNYYRLKQVDFDGQFEYSNIVNIQTIESSNPQTINIYPNPVTDELTIENGQGTAIIYNAVGQSVQEVNIDASKVQLKVSELPQGIYTIHIRKTNGESITKQFVK
jgi:hypothetical protein